MLRISKAAFVAALAAVLMDSFAAISAADFAGVWRVKDTAGKPFEITLSPNGTASASLRPDMVGTWHQQDAAAVIGWETGWTTKISVADGHYIHLAYQPHHSLDGPPDSTSDAEKVR